QVRIEQVRLAEESAGRQCWREYPGAEQDKSGKDNRRVKQRMPCAPSFGDRCRRHDYVLTMWGQVPPAHGGGRATQSRQRPAGTPVGPCPLDERIGGRMPRSSCDRPFRPGPPTAAVDGRRTILPEQRARRVPATDSESAVCPSALPLPDRGW